MYVTRSCVAGKLVQSPEYGGPSTLTNHGARGARILMKSKTIGLIVLYQDLINRQRLAATRPKSPPISRRIELLQVDLTGDVKRAQPFSAGCWTFQSHRH